MMENGKQKIDFKSPGASASPIRLAEKSREAGNMSSAFSIISHEASKYSELSREGLWILFVSCVMCLCVSVRVSAQESVTIESELNVEDVMNARRQPQQDQILKVKTTMKNSDIKIAQESEMDRGVVEEDVFDEKEMDEEVIAQELLDVQQEAIRADVIGEDDVLRINQTLRRAIEQNRKLQDEKKKMQGELGKLRGENRLDQTRREALEKQVKRYEERIQRAVEVQKELDGVIEQLQTKIKTREDVLLGRINDLQKQLESGVERAGVPASSAGVALQMDVAPLTMDATDPRPTGDDGGEDSTGIVHAQEEGLDVIRLIDDLDSMRQNMRGDEARVHYNMGNIFFHQGKHKEAVKEYEKVLAITPDDASAHFNLAYVSGDYLHRYETAMEHYQQYLFLNPGAEDASLVKEKILEAQLNIHSWSDKDVDRAVHDDLPNELYAW